MQFHIVGTDATPEVQRAKADLAVVLEFLGIEAVLEAQFSGVPGVGVIMTPDSEVSGLDDSNTVLLLDLDGTVRSDVIGQQRADGVVPVGVIKRPYAQQQIGSALRAVRARNALRLAPQTRDLPPSHAGIVAQLPGTHPVLDSLRVGLAATAEQEGSVLICGETGTGKRKIAEAIYRCSSYASGPFVPVSCATFPEALLAIELFGCESGALPGTTSRRIGRIEMAEGGVLLLEDIEALSIQSQASLLAFLRSKRLERVGSTRGAPCDVRLLASSSADLEALVEQGEFREDLFYAMQSQVVHVPALRDYVDAVPDMLAEFDPVFHSDALTDDAWQALANYSWPGNVTELQNFSSQMAPIAASSVLDVDELPERIRTGGASAAGEPTEVAGLPQGVLLPVNGLDLKPYLATLEKNLISQALEDTGFVVARAADRLHIRRTTLVEKMRKYGLQRS